jgi:prepilin-type N-terminal cleavage/methylation domain-containing protein
MKHNHKRGMPRFANEHGFTMLEILITMFLLTLWLLASAGVQSASLQFNKAAQFRTQAVYFATDIAERMQANKTGATEGSYVYSGSSTEDSGELHDVDLLAGTARRIRPQRMERPRNGGFAERQRNGDADHHRQSRDLSDRHQLGRPPQRTQLPGDRQHRGVFVHRGPRPSSIPRH